MKPLLSIVTITYKDPAGLKATLDSLEPLRSLDIAWEHIVVDSSLKENAGIIQSLPEDWPLEHIPSPPKGIYPAINLGVESAHGEALLLLHGGDRLRDPRALARLANQMAAAKEVDLICAAAALCRRGIFLYIHPAPKSWLRGLLGMNRFCHQAMLYRRTRLLKIGPFSNDFPIASDYEHHFRCYRQGMKMLAVSDCISAFDTGGTSSNTRQALAEFRAVQISLQKKLPAWMNILNLQLWWYEEKRIRLFKALLQSPAGNFLQSLWHSWKRRQS